MLMTSDLMINQLDTCSFLLLSRFRNPLHVNAREIDGLWQLGKR